MQPLELKCGHVWLWIVHWQSACLGEEGSGFEHCKGDVEGINRVMYKTQHLRCAEGFWMEVFHSAVCSLICFAASWTFNV